MQCWRSFRSYPLPHKHDLPKRVSAHVGNYFKTFQDKVKPVLVSFFPSVVMADDLIIDWVISWAPLGSLTCTCCCFPHEACNKTLRAKHGTNKERGSGERGSGRHLWSLGRILMDPDGPTITRFSNPMIYVCLIYPYRFTMNHIHGSHPSNICRPLSVHTPIIDLRYMISKREYHIE